MAQENSFHSLPLCSAADHYTRAHFTELLREKVRRNSTTLCSFVSHHLSKGAKVNCKSWSIVVCVVVVEYELYVTKAKALFCFLPKKVTDSPRILEGVPKAYLTLARSRSIQTDK